MDCFGHKLSELGTEIASTTQGQAHRHFSIALSLSLSLSTSIIIGQMNLPQIFTSTCPRVSATFCSQTKDRSIRTIGALTLIGHSFSSPPARRAATNFFNNHSSLYLSLSFPLIKHSEICKADWLVRDSCESRQYDFFDM
jgi:hypothetical protein